MKRSIAPLGQEKFSTDGTLGWVTGWYAQWSDASDLVTVIK